MIDALTLAGFGGLFRAIESLVSAGATLLVGLLVAAVLRYYLGKDGTLRLFGGNTMRSLPQSWAVGMLLPVCSIGVLPILFEMRRSGVKPGAMSAFALSAPLFNPLSLLYGLTLSRPYVILMFVFGSLIVVTVVGLLWDWLAPETQEVADADPPADGLIGVRRMAAAAIFAARALCGPVGLWTLVAVSGMLLMGAILPHGALQHGVARDDWFAPARMILVAVPAYATPMLTMSQMGMMFQHANSPGAAFNLLVLGTGLNFATILWLGRGYGAGAVTRWFSGLLIVMFCISYSINKPLIPPGVQPSDHTHAFDIYTNPLQSTTGITKTYVDQQVEKKITLIEQFTLSFVGVALLLGLVFRTARITETSVEQKDSSAPDLSERYDRIVAPQTVGITMLIGLVAISIAMCYGFYPPPGECIKEVQHFRAETLAGAKSGDFEHALYWIPSYDDWVRRTEVGAFLRSGSTTPYQRMQGYLIRKKLETLEHALMHEPPDQTEINKIVDDLTVAHLRWSESFRDAK